MTVAEMRQQAMSALRGQMRYQGIDPRTVSGEGAYAFFDEWVTRGDATSAAQRYYFKMTDAQYKTFCAEWRKQWA